MRDGIDLGSLFSRELGVPTKEGSVGSSYAKVDGIGAFGGR